MDNNEIKKLFLKNYLNTFPTKEARNKIKKIFLNKKIKNVIDKIINNILNRKITKDFIVFTFLDKEIKNEYNLNYFKKTINNIKNYFKIDDEHIFIQYLQDLEKTGIEAKLPETPYFYVFKIDKNGIHLVDEFGGYYL